MSASNTRGRAWRWPIVGFAFLMVPFALAQGREEAIPPYQAVAGIAGTLSIQAGDIPGNLAAVGSGFNRWRVRPDCRQRRIGVYEPTHG